MFAVKSTAEFRVKQSSGVGLIYADDQDHRLRLLETLAEACERTDWQVHAVGLMSPHFHRVSETP